MVAQQWSRFPSQGVEEVFVNAVQHSSGLSLHTDAVTDHQLGETVAVDQHDAGVDPVGLLAGRQR